jgi:hypothetical protein
LWDPLRREPRLVEEDPPKVVAVGENLRLEREERSTRVDEINARQPVLLGDLLGAQMLLHREWEVGAALDRRVVRDQDALSALDHADPGDDPGRRRGRVVDLPGGERRQLQERGTRIEQPVDPLARGQLSARAVSLHRLVAPAAGDSFGSLAQLCDELLHPLPAAIVLVRPLDVGLEDGHGTQRIAPPFGP